MLCHPRIGLRISDEVHIAAMRRYSSAKSRQRSARYNSFDMMSSPKRKTVLMTLQGAAGGIGARKLVGLVPESRYQAGGAVGACIRTRLLAMALIPAVSTPASS